MKGTGKSYTVKTWMANKIANEIKMHISACDVFAIIKETEKAVYAMLDLGCGHRKTMWIPKSALESFNIVENPFERAYYETIYATYDEAVEAFNAFWESFK